MPTIKSIHSCNVNNLKLVEGAPANVRDWDSHHSTQGYMVMICDCGNVWGLRYQWDAGIGQDDRWHNFGKVDPMTVKRHY